MFLKFKIVIVISILSFTLFNCKEKQREPDPIPYQPVEITIYPNDPIYFKVQTIGGWLYLNGGVQGILLYRSTQTEFLAYERASTYLPDNAYALAKVQSDNFTCRDTVSNSKWQIIDGAVISGPATFPLRQYQTTYDGNALRIFN